jgi:hypothetical protein
MEEVGSGNIVGCRWVFALKRGPDGSIERYKARIVAKGFSQVYQVDYEETFVPVVKWASIRILLAIGAHLDLEIDQMDVKTAFLNGELEHTIFMVPPPGSIDYGNDDIVWKLRKSLYGLKQASRAWYQKAKEEFGRIGFTRCDSDHAVFIHRGQNKKFCIIALYVDDLMVLCNDVDLLNFKKEQLKRTFKMKDLGPIHWFLGLEITRDRPRCLIYVSQNRYVTDIVERFGFSNARPISTPVTANFKLPRLDTPEVNVRDYQSRIGSIMYAMLGTRPDIAYAVGALSQYSASPGLDHLNAVNRVLKYLNCTKDYKLMYNGGDREGDFTAYSDSDWAGDPRDHRSISGYVFKVAGGAVSWSSKKQPSTALSSTEGEYMALTHVAKEAIWIQGFIGDVLRPPSIPTTILGDNQGALALAVNPAFHACTKHIRVRQHFIRDCIYDGDVALEYIPTADQIADIFTKGLTFEKHDKFAKGMGIVDRNRR